MSSDKDHRAVEVDESHTATANRHVEIFTSELVSIVVSESDAQRETRL